MSILSLTFKYLLTYSFNVYGCFTCMYVYVPCACLVPQRSKEIISPPTTRPYPAKTEARPPVKTEHNENSGNNENLIKHLKDFRLKQSRREGIAPYLIFNNAQMDDLIAKMPHTPDELLKVSGFGITKVNKYGESILKILWEFTS